MKFFGIILAVASALTLNAQTNPVENTAGTPLFNVPTVTLNLRTNPPVPALATLTNAAVTALLTNAPARTNGPIYIESEHWVGDLKNRIAVYSGNVIVTNEQMKMTCDQLTAQAPTNSSHIHMDNVIAEGNVKIIGEDDKGQPVRVRCDKAVYVFKIVNLVTNDTITLTGDVHVDSAMFKGTGEPIVWDRIKNSIYGENMRMEIQPDTKPGTNSPPDKKGLPKFL